MNMEHGNSLSASAHPQVSHRPARSFRLLQWLNGGVHWISAVVLVYAFISNGETTRALINPVAMRGEVKLGLAVGLIFLVRFIWVQSTHSGGGRWVRSSVRMPRSKIRRISDWGIYLGVGGFRCLGTSDRISSTGCRAYPRKQRVYHQQRGAKRCD
jgi:hypothetical protein